MAHNQSENGRDKAIDESGNMTRRTEDPVQHGATKATTKNGTHDPTRMEYGTRGTTGTGNGRHGTATGPTGFAATTAGGHGFPIVHCPESSSSYEDDGKENLPGGNSDHEGTTNTPPINTKARENKEMKETIKENLPGGNTDHSGITNTPVIDTSAHEKKGTKEKIEEKLPGSGGHSDGHSAATNTPIDINAHENDGGDQRVVMLPAPTTTKSIKLID